MGKSPEVPFEAQQIKYISSDFIEETEFQHPLGSPIEEIDYIIPDDYEGSLQATRAIDDQPNTITVSTNPERRTRREREKYEEIKSKFPEGNPDARREDFGDGKAGEVAFQIIKAGAECVAYIDDNHNACGNLSIGTKDMDNATELDFFPFCSQECELMLEDQLIKNKHEKSSNTLGLNGLGRN